MDPILQEEFIIFYNVENLFVADAEPSFGGGSPASGLRGWNMWRYSNKLGKIAQVFGLAQERYNALPLFIGISEVQGQKPLDDMVKLPPLAGKYSVVHYESMDERGVDTALLYNREKMELVASEPISFVFEINDKDPENYDRTRDILHCTLKYKGVPLHVFVCHLPSRRQKDVNKPRRNFILTELRSKVNALLQNDEPVIVMGDFNANPDDEHLMLLLQDEQRNKSLTNPFLELYNNKKYSTFHFAEGLLFDQIFLSKHFFGGSFPLKFSEADVFAPNEIISRKRNFNGRPFRTYAGTRYLGGYSDHFPVIAKFSQSTISN